MNLNFDNIADIVRNAGHPCYVDNTGGGCATIMAGHPFIDDHGDKRFPILAGPGGFEGGSFAGAAIGDTDEFYIGPDDDGDSPLFYIATDEDDNVSLARKIVQALQCACTCNPERPGDCRSMGCDPECSVC